MLRGCWLSGWVSGSVGRRGAGRGAGPAVSSLPPLSRVQPVSRLRAEPSAASGAGASLPSPVPGVPEPAGQGTARVSTMQLSLLFEVKLL